MRGLFWKGEESSWITDLEKVKNNDWLPYWLTVLVRERNISFRDKNLVTTAKKKAILNKGWGSYSIYWHYIQG